MKIWIIIFDIKYFYSKKFTLFVRFFSVSLTYVTISETCYLRELHSENLLSRQYIIDHICNLPTSMLSRIFPICPIIDRDYCFLQATLLRLKFPQIHAKESYKDCNRSAWFFCSFQCVKTSCDFFDRNHRRCQNFSTTLFDIMRIISLHCRIRD